MDNLQEALLKTMSEHFAQMSAQLSTQLTTHIDNRLNQFVARLDSMERTPRPPFEHEPKIPLSPLTNPRRVQQPDPFRDPNPRRPNQDFIDQEERAFRSIRLEAPTFDGTLDTKVYLDWEKEMDQYFEWYEMTEGRKFKFAKLRLIRQAKMYWDNVERLVRQRGQEPTAT